jgi:hypothetical protein
MVLVNRAHIGNHFDGHDPPVKSLSDQRAGVRLRVSRNPYAKVEHRWRLLSFKSDPVSIQPQASPSVGGLFHSAISSFGMGNANENCTIWYWSLSERRGPFWI